MGKALRALHSKQKTVSIMNSSHFQRFLICYQVATRLHPHQCKPWSHSFRRGNVAASERPSPDKATGTRSDATSGIHQTRCHPTAACGRTYSCRPGSSIETCAFVLASYTDGRHKTAYDRHRLSAPLDHRSLHMKGGIAI